MINIDTIIAVIPAAGQGKRMGSELNKQYLSLLGKPILAYTIEAFQQLELISEVIVVVKEEELAYCQQQVIDRYDLESKCSLVVGGATRQESVYNGLQAVEQADYVLIHDGARPLVKQETIKRSLQELKKHGAVGVAVPVKDTIKRVDEENFVQDTPERDRLWAIQTPQAFEYSLALQAYRQAFKDEFLGTDTAMLVERLDKRVKLIKGSYENLKVTTPEDLSIAETIINRRQRCE
ncbi:2-C-methyl-D-erythritol 4-phosphate cytidylyltransferase [Fuchsiella alkaliacetigena]|uniref:2-C-methyl-D-erythritol 4-phosphate cytidylyltransferase n=1 Tax=Fuchsiella alkaliacetigena TaxID=957042 RepID=UPI00200B409B|nr:2-C-methyl-D-erythritol 4-phosphate cytidylyltransferase [Fuchsiella alkaliacetigena]MCK8825827.1 2-C-methyl-D-erythritol 4-phosphate cytidylyltransferase [Fuchsiella alkaliacetigena]